MIKKINASNAFFIKLGSKGKWESECIENGILRLGFSEFEHEDMMRKKFNLVREYYESIGTSKQWVTIYENQLRNFYESDETVIWITFYKQKLWWCFGTNEFVGKGKNEKIRKTMNGWSSKDILGNDLLVDNLSGEVLKIQGFQSTICKVSAFDYLIQKINGENSPEVTAVKTDLNNLHNSIGKLITKLAPKDFEVLVDLIFRQTGYQRTNVLGGPQKTKDIELISSVTGERILVQVKCSSNIKIYKEYEDYFNELDIYDRFFYVVHTTDNKLSTLIPSNDKVSIWRLNDISKLVVNSGLVNWIINKVK